MDSSGARPVGDVGEGQNISRPLRAPSALDATRASALVALVWILAALPYVFGWVECPTARFFDVPCPGCGMTRAFRLFAHGDVLASLRMHALALPTALVQVGLAVASIVATARYGAPWELGRVRWGRAVLFVTALVLLLDVLFWIARALGAFGGPVTV
jgi:hypothetical protein